MISLKYWCVQIFALLAFLASYSYGTPPPPDASNTYPSMTLSLSGTVMTNEHNGCNSSSIGTLTVVLHNNGTNGWVNPFFGCDGLVPGSTGVGKVWVTGNTTIQYSGTIPVNQTWTTTATLVAATYAGNGDTRTVVSPTYLAIGWDPEQVYIPVSGQGQLGSIYSNPYPNVGWYQGSATLTGIPSAVHLYRNASALPSGGREGVSDQLIVTATIQDEGTGPGTKVEFQVGGRRITEGFTQAGIPAVQKVFSATITEADQGGSLQNLSVKLLLDNQQMDEIITPSPFPNHQYPANFGILRIGGACHECQEAGCVMGRTVAELRLNP